MRTLLYLSTFCLALFLLPGCSDKPTDGTYVTMFVINEIGITEDSREVYVFKEVSDSIVLKKPSDALTVKTTDGNGMVQFNLEDPDLFNADESAVFSFRVMEFQNGDFVTLASFEKEIRVGEAVNHTLIL
jgi:hypothetical protein